MAGQDEIEPGVILERLKNLDEGQSDIKTMVECLVNNFQAFREQYIRDHVTLANKTDAAHARLDKLEPKVELIWQAIQPMITMNRWLGRIAAVLGVSIL